MIDDVRLIDDVIAAIAAMAWPEPMRMSPTQLLAFGPSATGFRGGLFVDAGGGWVGGTCYPLDSNERVPEERISPMAELLNLIARSGVPFGVGLDLDGGVVRFKTNAFVTTAPLGDRKLLLQDLVVNAAGARLLYEGPVRRVAFDDLAPQAAFDEVEAYMAEIRQSEM